MFISFISYYKINYMKDKFTYPHIILYCIEYFAELGYHMFGDTVFIRYMLVQ